MVSLLDFFNAFNVLHQWCNHSKQFDNLMHEALQDLASNPLSD